MKNKKIFIILGILLLVAILCPNIAHAATDATLHFCEYGGTRRTFKIIGMVIFIVKIVVPLIIIITGVMTFSKTVFSGKDEDLKANFITLVKKIVAGIIVFVLPSTINTAFDMLVGYDDSSFTACTTCMLNPNGCVIPTEDPDTYRED